MNNPSLALRPCVDHFGGAGFSAAAPGEAMNDLTTLPSATFQTFTSPL